MRSTRLTYLICLVLVLGPVSAAWAQPEGLVAYWPFDEGQGETAIDASGNGNDGTLSGGATWVAGQIGGALQFNGSNAYVTAPHIPFDNRSFTIALWVNPGGLSGQQSVFSQTESRNTNLSLHLRLCGPGASYGPIGGLRMGFYSNDLDTPTDVIENNNWYHLTCTYDYDSQVRRIYLDGELSAEGTGAAPFLGATGDTIIGSWDGTEEYFNGMIDDVQVYSRALAENEVRSIMEGLGAKGMAVDPVPADEATDVPREATLSWTAGEYAATHNVYFGTAFDDVNDAEAGSPLLVSQGLSSTMYDPPGRLEFGRTYYWRVDEVNAAPDDTVFAGEVWSFTVEPALYAIADIVATASIPSAVASGGLQAAVNGSGLTNGMHGIADETMWSAEAPEGAAVWMQFNFDRVYKLYGIQVWNYNGLYEGFLGFGLQDVTIEYATEPNAWMPLGDFQLAKATSKTTYAGQLIDLDGVSVQSIRINVNSNFSGRASYGLAEIQFLQKPVFAREPQPADEATKVDRGSLLSWRPGREAASHDVHLGTDANEVATGAALAGTATTSTFDPGPLTLGTTYYWKVDEVNDIETPVLWDSALWSFTTQEYVPIDDFESYTDEEGGLVYEAWLDGYGVTENGSQVGHDNPPYAETRIRNGGNQAMPLYYDNIEGVAYSEAALTLSPPQDWTANGANTLSLHYRGDPIAFLETTPGNILMSGMGADIYELTDEFRYAYKQLTGDGSITARVDSIQNTNEWAKAGVMIRATLQPGAMQALSGVGPLDRAEWIYRENAGTNITNANTDVNEAPVPLWVRVTRQGNTFTGEYSTDGQTWLTVANTTPGTIEMPNTVYIGLAVCSHVSGTSCAAAFSSVSTTGNVTGQWQLASVGVEQPVGNDLDTLYLAVEDSGGARAILSNPDSYAVATGTWTPWQIPLSDIVAAGVDVTKVTKVYLGVGDRAQPSKNASGVLYIDDLAFGRSIVTEQP